MKIQAVKYKWERKTRKIQNWKLQIGRYKSKYTTQETPIQKRVIGSYGKYKSGKYKSEKNSRTTQIGKYYSESRIRNIHVENTIRERQTERIQVGKYKAGNTTRKIKSKNL